VEFPGIRVKIEDKPDLAELWHWLWDLRAAESAAKNRYWAAESEAKRAELLASMPAGSVAVKRIGSAPDPWEAGMSIGVWQAEDGRAFAGGPDKEADGIGYITEERLAKCAERYAADQKRDAERKQQQADAAAKYQAELKATVVPADALAAYRRYRGDDEKAWEQSDEGAWADIRKYRDAIELQGLA
jgi:hypothetical protein